MRTEFLSACGQLVIGAVNGLFQGIVVAVLVALSLRALGRINAATRHAVWFCTLLLVISLVVAHCLIGPMPLTRQAPKTNDIATAPSRDLDLVPPVATAAQDTAVWPGIDSLATAAFHNYQTVGPEAQLKQKAGSQTPPLTEATALAAQFHLIGNSIPHRAKPNGNESENVASAGGQLVGSNISGETTRLHWLAKRLLNPTILNLGLGSRVPMMASVTLLVLWLIGAVIRVFVLLLQLFRIQKLKHRSFLPGAGLGELFQNLATRLGVNRRVELKVSPAHRSSLLLGFFHPVILLPAEGRMEPREAELVLRHELAHVMRRDDWANLVQHFILAVFFFHPAVWWICKQLSLERQIACDDHVLEQSERPQAYALLLADLAARMQRELPLLAPGSSNNRTQLKQRIDMILNTHRNTSPGLAKTWLACITSAVALAAVAIICSAPRIILAQNETTPAAASAPSADASLAATGGGITSIALAAGASDAESADSDPPTTPAPAAVGPGPKFKPGNPSAQNVRSAVIAAPAVPSAPIAASAVVAAPVPPTPFLAAVGPAPEPKAPRTPRPPRGRTSDSSLEERLERLEQMVESLMAQQNLKPGRFDFHLKGPGEKDVMIDRKEIAKIEAFAKQQAELARKQAINPKEIEKIKEQAEREVARAAEQAKRATMEAEKGLKGEQKLHTTRKFKEGHQRQLETLRKQIEILEREKEKLDRQIEQLEQDQEQLDEQRDEDQAGDDTQPEKSKAECGPQQSAAL